MSQNILAGFALDKIPQFAIFLEIVVENFDCDQREYNIVTQLSDHILAQLMFTVLLFDETLSLVYCKHS